MVKKSKNKATTVKSGGSEYIAFSCPAAIYEALVKWQKKHDVPRWTDALRSLLARSYGISMECVRRQKHKPGPWPEAHPGRQFIGKYEKAYDRGVMVRVLTPDAARRMRFGVVQRKVVKHTGDAPLRGKDITLGLRLPSQIRSALRMESDRLRRRQSRIIKTRLHKELQSFLIADRSKVTA